MAERREGAHRFRADFSILFGPEANNFTSQSPFGMRCVISESSQWICEQTIQPSNRSGGARGGRDSEPPPLRRPRIHKVTSDGGSVSVRGFAHYSRTLSSPTRATLVNCRLYLPSGKSTTTSPRRGCGGARYADTSDGLSGATPRSAHLQELDASCSGTPGDMGARSPRGL
ncbi:unnamed protein product [Pleuronectes platessa]|uniref:Uncharacterized protein n=1 Tax=Pleuronectes platessa TaxID=8262 RepID=A0A9N7YYP1_PLEPL|nr:unnamed protein product [Pleuronectes platessa]